MQQIPEKMESFGQWVDHIGYPAEQCIQRSAPVGDMSLFKISQTQAIDDPATPEFTLNLVTCGQGSRFELDFAHGRFGIRNEPGQLVLSPADNYNRFAGDEAFELLLLAWSAADIRRRLGEVSSRPFGGFKALHSKGFRDPEIEYHLRQLYRITQAASDGPSRLRFDGHAHFLLAALINRADKSALGDAGRHDLSMTGLNALRDYIAAHLDQPLSIDRLAQVAGIPSFSFGSAFKAAFGEAPYRYVSRRRIEHACDMLRDPRHSIADIAVACGCYDQAHLTRLFRAHLGTTPGAWRRDVLA